MTEEVDAGASVSLRDLIVFARRPYHGLKLSMAARAGGGLVVVGAILVSALAAADPPVSEGAALGWSVVGVGVAANLVLGGICALGRMKLRPAAILVLGYVSILEIGVVVWLSGGGNSVYTPLFLLPLLYGAAIHPPRRLLYLFVFTVVVYVVSMGQGDPSTTTIVRTAVELPLWAAIGAFTMLVFTYLRWQQFRLGIERAHARRLARIDSLTGLGNQRSFWEAMRTEVAHARRSGNPLSMAMGDVDRFKDVNDRFGHREGDALLARIGRALRDTARASDRCFRYGGDEFALILRDQPVEGAVQAAERFRAAAALRGTSGDVGATMTFGVAEYSPSMTDEDLVRCADSALYRAKQLGRNRTGWDSRVTSIARSQPRSGR